MQRRERDALTEQYFNDRVTVRIRDRERIAKRSERLFGRALSDREWARLVGAPDGATIDVRAGASGAAVRLALHHPLVRVMSRLVALDPLGRTFMRNEELFLRADAPAGFGTRILAHQVREASRLGVAYLETTALRGPAANGYYTWPLLGFNEPLPDRIQQVLPPDLRPAQDLHGLFNLPGGDVWWRLHGETIDVHFDLDEESRSLLRLEAYLERRAISIAGVSDGSR